MSAAFLALLAVVFVGAAVLPTTRLGWPAAVSFAAAGFDPRAEAVLLAVLFSAVAVLGLAFAATIFTEGFGAWLLPDRAAAVDRLLRFVAGMAVARVAVVAFASRGAGRAAAMLLRAFAAVGLATVGLAAVDLAFAEDRGFVAAVGGFLATAGDFLLALVAAVAAFVVAFFAVAALVVATLVLGGMA